MEYDHWVLVETDHRIIKFCEQPLRISSTFEGNLVESIFDMWIQYKDGQEQFVEVKYSKELDPSNPKSKRSLRQTIVQRNWCQENQFSHLVQTEQEIRANSLYLANMKQLIGYIKNRRTAIETDQYQVLQLIKNHRATLAEIEEVVRIDRPRAWEAIFWLAYSGLINTDLDKRLISPLTEVWMLNGEQTPH